MEFGAFLKKAIKDIGVPVTHLSSEIDYSRVNIYSVFRGERKLPEDTFELILSKYDFSEFQVAELKRLFYAENLSEDKKELLDFLKKELEKLGKESFVSPFPLRNVEICNEGVILTGSVDYYSAIAAFLKNEADCINNVIYTNYSFSDFQTDSMLYEFAKNTQNGTVIKHNVQMGAGSDIKERIRNIFSSVKFAKLCHITNIPSNESAGFSLETYFIGSKTVLQYDMKNQCGFLTGEPAIVNAFRLAEIQNEKTCTPLNGFSSSALELKKVLAPHQKHIVSLLDFRFPATHFTTKKILSETINENLEYHDAVVDEFWNHLHYFQLLHLNGTFSQYGIRKFALDGIVSDASPIFLHPISVENRIELFKIYKQNIAKTNYAYKIINSDRLNITENCAFEIYSDGFSILFCSERNIEKNFIGGCYIIYKDKDFSKLFLAFKEYISLNDGVLSQKYAEILVDELIGLCNSILKKSKTASIGS